MFFSCPLSLLYWISLICHVPGGCQGILACCCVEEVEAPLEVQAPHEVHDQPVQAPQVLGENDLGEQFLFEAALEKRDDLHASDEEIQQLGQVEFKMAARFQAAKKTTLSCQTLKETRPLQLIGRVWCKFSSGGGKGSET